MPGYLGSEKQFIRRYQKPLLASSRERDLEHGKLPEIISGMTRRVFIVLFRTISHGCFTQAS